MSETSKLRRVCACALSDGIPLRSFYVALIVGTFLTLINQGDALFARASLNWFKVVLTYFVPYAVCSYGAVSAQMKSGMGTNLPTCR